MPDMTRDGITALVEETTEGLFRCEVTFVNFGAGDNGRPDYLYFGRDIIDFGKEISVLTDARFSGVSTGACIGHIGPEALAGGPVGKLHDGDMIQIIVDCEKLTGSIDLVGEAGRRFSPEEGAEVLSKRESVSEVPYLFQ